MQRPERSINNFIGPDGTTRIVRRHRTECRCEECLAYYSELEWQQRERELLNGRTTARSNSIYS